MDGPDLSLYLHIPFCLSRCSYCDFYSVTDLDPAGRVVDRAIEAGARTLERLGSPRLATIYVGGGTPSALRPADLARLLGAARSWSTGTPDEVTVEANPETLTDAFLDVCAAAGVTRLSVGVQSLSPGLLALLGRRATRQTTLAALERVGIRWKGQVSVDLLAGIPSQTWRQLDADLKAVLAFAPGHMSLYTLTREPDTPFDRMIRAGRLAEMPAGEQERLWLRGAQLLRRRGFRHYEISNFALPGRECRHNLRTWRLDPYLGVGPAAVSTLPGGPTGVRRLNEPRSVRAWLDGAPPQIEEVAAPDFFFENLMMGLRVSDGVPMSALRARFGEEALEWLRSRWDSLAAEHGTRVRRGRLALTRRGWLLLSRLLLRLQDELRELRLEAPPVWPDAV